MVNHLKIILQKGNHEHVAGEFWDGLTELSGSITIIGLVSFYISITYRYMYIYIYIYYIYIC